MSSKRMDQIIRLIEEEAAEVKNPDPVSRLYAVKMKISQRIFEQMLAIREQERCQKKNP